MRRILSLFPPGEVVTFLLKLALINFPEREDQKERARKGNSMQKWASPISKFALLGLGLLIHIAFFISACWTKWFNYFFSGSSLHLCCRGLDFYTVPNGAYSFWHGGPLSVTYRTAKYLYSLNFLAANANINHPLLTLTLGSFLILFSPAASFYVWMFTKLFVNLALLTYFFISFRQSKYIYLATFLSLINSTQYLEIEIAQFQFVLNTFLFLMLIVLVKNEKSPLSGYLYFLTLIGKPIGLLWIPLLFFKKQWEMLVIGLNLFVIATGIFLINYLGDYYIANLLGNFFYPIKSGPIQIITLDALLRYSTHWPDSTLTAIKWSCLVLVIILSASKRISLQTGIFLAIAYYLLFYDMTFEYHYTTLIPILAICLITRPEFQKLSSRICIVLISLPNVLFLLHLLYSWHFKLGPFDATKTMKMDPYLGPDPTARGWQLCVLSRIIPVIALVICVVQPVVVPIAKDAFSSLKSSGKAIKNLRSLANSHELLHMPMRF